MAQDDKDKPWISNYPPLQAWLNEHDARCDWQIPYGNKNKPAMYVEQWRTRGGREFIITVMANQGGWNVYSPCDSNSIVETLADLEARLGMKAG